MVRLEHNNVRTLDLEATIAFYENIVGLKVGEFPGAPGQGAWLYDDEGTPVIHIVAIDPAHAERALATINERTGESVETLDQGMVHGSGAIDHIAFGCTDYALVRARIDEHGLPFRLNEVASMSIRQIFVHDPSGILIELNFRG